MFINNLSEILDRQEIQILQDRFTRITGVASVITELDGTPFTGFSGICSFCSAIRNNPEGMKNCLRNNVNFNDMSSDRVSLLRCPATDLWETGVKIRVAGQHVGNWIIGQVKPEDFDPSVAAEFAFSLGMDRMWIQDAVSSIPEMKETDFTMILEILHLFANQLSSLAYRKYLLKKEIAEKNAISRQLNYLNFHDPETGLINRQLCEERIDHLIQVGLRTGKDSFSLIMISLAGIKHHKELYGPEGVKTIVSKLARVLMVSVRNEDTVCRFSTDEFLIVIENHDNSINSPEIVYERILHTLEAGVTLENSRVKIHIHGGMVSWNPSEKIESSQLVRKCYAALQESRKKDCPKLVVYTEDMFKAVMFEYELEKSFDKAIREEEIVPYFQPIVKLNEKNGSKVYGYEVLARWNHPRYGILMPGLFIPLAEQHDMLRELTAYIIRKGARFIKEINRENRDSPLFISINITPDEFIRQDLVNMIQKILQEEELPGHWIKLEITENSILKGGEDSIDKIRELNEMGIQISMDDFGTGYSNLSLLCRLPLNNLKLDKSLIMMAEENENFIQAVIRMADSLNLEIIAEGVEKQSQIDILKKMGCYLHQGFFYSLPMDAQTIKSAGLTSSSRELIH